MQWKQKSKRQETLGSGDAAETKKIALVPKAARAYGRQLKKESFVLKVF